MALGRSGRHSKPLDRFTIGLKSSCSSGRAATGARSEELLVIEAGGSDMGLPPCQTGHPVCPLAGHSAAQHPHMQPGHHSTAWRRGLACMAQTVVGDSVLLGIIGGGTPASRASCRRLGTPAPEDSAAASPTARIRGPASASAIIWCPRSLGCVLHNTTQRSEAGGGWMRCSCSAAAGGLIQSHNPARHSSTLPACQPASQPANSCADLSW